MSTVREFIQDSSTAQTETEVFACFSKALRSLGFDAEAYFLLNNFHDAHDRPYKAILNTGPPVVIDLYVKDRLEPTNSTHYLARTTGKNYSWYDKPSNIDLHNDYKYFLGELYSTGLTSGFAIPVFGQGTEQAFVNIGNYHGKADESSEEAQIARLLSYHLHERIKEIMGIRQEVLSLSEREREVLQWVMAGKSDSVIADIMAISSHTVDTYLRRCYQKLNVSNRVAAVVKAISLGIITP